MKRVWKLISAFGLMVALLFTQANRIGITLMLLGAGLNLLAVSLNHWRMPVFGFRRKKDSFHAALTASARVKSLCDVFNLSIYGKDTITFSIGDVVIAIGFIYIACH